MTATACSSQDHQLADEQSAGTVSIPLETTVGTSTYRLDAVFVLSGVEGDISLATVGDESVLSTTLPAGSYSAFLESFTLFKKDSTGTFYPVSATVVANPQAFTVVAGSTTTVNFQFATDGTTVSIGPGDVNITFGVTETSCNPIITVDSAARTLRTSRFFLDFSNHVGNDPEELDTISWLGSGNYTSAVAPSDLCSSGEDQYFGNSWTETDPENGGSVLVGSGSTGSWQADSVSLLIHSMSTGCPHSSAIPVETRYRFRDGLGADTIEVDRKFAFGNTPLQVAFRPFVPRIVLNLDLVLHPNADGTELRTESVYDGSRQTSDFDGSWFAFTTTSGPSAGQGVIVLRKTTPIATDLVIDTDGLTWTNASAALLLPPSDGFTGDVTEQELLCFFTPETWTPAQQAALTLPAGCTLDLACNAGVPVTECEPNPCQHDGICSEVPGGHTCTCLPGINGENCEQVFTHIESGLASTCGIRTDGKMACWGDASYSDPWPPADTFETLGVTLTHLCAVHTGGAAECWRNDGEPATQPPELPFTSVAPAGGDVACGILTNGRITCWGDYSLFFDSPPPGSFQTMSFGNWHACALGTDNTVTCWGVRGGMPAGLDFGQTQPPAGTFLAVRSGETASCGLRSDHTIACWGAASNGTPLVPPAGTFIALDYRADYGCGVRTDKTLACWGLGSFGSETTPPAGTYTSVATGNYHPCAINTDGSIVCWGAFAGPDWEQPPTGQP
jgi:hypothetical protein